MSQQRAASSPSLQGAQGSIPFTKATIANAGLIVVLSPDGVIPAKPSRISYHSQEQADRAILASTSSAEAWRSEPGRQVDGTSDQTERARFNAR